MSRLRTADLSLYLVTDAALCGSRGVAEVVRAAVDGGVRIVQLREKHASDAHVADELVALSAVIDGRALLVVDDRLDAAMAARARGARVDGIHLGQSDASAEDARRALGAEAIIGLTANTPAHLEAVRALPAGTVDYLGVGVIHPTATKPDHPPALGVDGFAAFAAASPLPCVAIGGIGGDDVAPLRDAGAAGIAVVSALCAAADPRAAAEGLRRIWDAAAPPTVPRVLSIAGSDPSGGAGIQADLKSIAAAGGYGMAAITALTVQNTRGVQDVHTPPADVLRAQLDAISADIVIDAVKIGMLGGADAIGVVAGWLRAHRPPVVVLDPVMVATSGDRLLDESAVAALRALLPLADVVTPNLPELAVLLDEPVAGSWADALVQARRLAERIGALVLVKGGHLDGDEAPDALVSGSGTVREYRGARIATGSTHGTGCSLSAGLAARRAAGAAWPDAVAETRAWLRESIGAGAALRVGGGHGPIDHFAGMRARAGVRTRPSADEVAAQWWDRIAGIRAGIDGLGFIRGLADGSLPEPAFRFYLGQDALYLRDYARVLAEASRTAPTSDQQAFWAESARGSIEGELELHASWLAPGSGVGGRLFEIRPGAATIAYLDHLRATAFDGEHAVLAAALLPCFWLYTDLGVRLRDGAFGSAAQDPGHPYASWLATYADPAFEEANARAIAIVAELAAEGDEGLRERMYAAFERSARHELAFFAAADAGAV